MTPDTGNVLILLAAAMLVFAALHDVAFRTIPNWVSAALAVDGGLQRLLDHELLVSLYCSLAVFVLAAFCWYRSWLGGGDVKLLGASAILVPPDLVPGFIAAVAFAGGGIALVYLLLERIVPAPRLHRQASFLRRIMVVERRRIHRRASLPYATAISAAALLMLTKG